MDDTGREARRSVSAMIRGRGFVSEGNTGMCARYGGTRRPGGRGSCSAIARDYGGVASASIPSPHVPGRHDLLTGLHQIAIEYGRQWPPRQLKVINAVSRLGAACTLPSWLCRP
ncbi:hypothetical protein GCM10020219_035620 [Nonomuraea dietziae]